MVRTHCIAVNPDLVILRISGWGQTGPYRERPGFGTLVEAMSGFAHLNGEADRPPMLPPLAMADMVAGLYGSFAAMTALRVVERGIGRGQVIDLSLFEPMLSLVASEAVKYRATGDVTMRSGNQATHTAPRNVYRVRRRWLSRTSQARCSRWPSSSSTPSVGPSSTPIRALPTNDARVANRTRSTPSSGPYRRAHAWPTSLRPFRRAARRAGRPGPLDG